MKLSFVKISIRFILLALALPMTHCAFGQDELTELTVDRPGFADTPFTVPSGMYQFEFGFDYFKRPTGEFYNLPVGMLRTGISKRSEIRVSTRHILDNTDGNSFKGITPLSLGVKMHVIKERKWIPETDIMTNVIIPMSETTSQSSKLGYEVLLLFQHDFYPNTALNYNIGYVWDSFQGKSVFTVSVCFNYLPTRRIGLYIEYFGFGQNKWPGEQGFDGGITYLLAPNFQVDISSGVSRLEDKNNFFASSGFTFRINPIKE